MKLRLTRTQEKIKISFEVSRTMKETLEQEAQMQGKSFNSIIIEALRDFVERNKLNLSFFSRAHTPSGVLQNG